MNSTPTAPRVAKLTFEKIRTGMVDLTEPDGQPPGLATAGATEKKLYTDLGLGSFCWHCLQHNQPFSA